MNLENFARRETLSKRIDKNREILSRFTHSESRYIGMCDEDEGKQEAKEIFIPRKSKLFGIICKYYADEILSLQKQLEEL